jgi:hypothetical protein
MTARFAARVCCQQLLKLRSADGEYWRARDTLLGRPKEFRPRKQSSRSQLLAGCTAVAQSSCELLAGNSSIGTPFSLVCELALGKVVDLRGRQQEHAEGEHAVLRLRGSVADPQLTGLFAVCACGVPELGLHLRPGV